MPDPMQMPPDSELRWFGAPTPGQAVQATIGLVHPGDMGAAVGASAGAAGAQVLWASDGRSPATCARAERAQLQDVGWLNGLVNRSDMVLSVCPPGAAESMAEEVTALGFNRLYVDANAVSPETARRIAARIEETGADFVDGGIIGSPPWQPDASRMYLSGAEAPRAARMLAGGPMDIIVLDAPVGAASALKMAYGAWTKGTSALLTAIEALALAEGVSGALHKEWAGSQPEMEAKSAGLKVAAAKAWRWVAEMEEISATFAHVGLPPGFHEASAEVYRRLEQFKDDAGAPGGAELARHILPNQE